MLIGDRVLRVIATHFGLHAVERRLQANRLMAVLGEPLAANRRLADAVLLMGDLNEWRGRSGAIRLLDRRLGPSAAARAFPSWLPVLALDRIYAGGPAVLRDVYVYRSPLARLACQTTCRWSAVCAGTVRDPRRREAAPLVARRVRPPVSRCRHSAALRHPRCWSNQGDGPKKNRSISTRCSSRP
jgi:hypothetical protein